MPTVSVIIPTYNRAHVIRDAISSVLQQTYQDFEILVVDDGSKDETDAVMETFTDRRIKYIKQANGGSSSARNTAIRHAQGEYVAFLDSDDMYLPEKLAKQVAKIQADQTIGMVYTRHYVTTGQQTSWRLEGAQEEELSLQSLLLKLPFCFSTSMIRRSWLERIGGFDESLKVAVDRDLIVRLALAGCRIICLPEALTIYRVEPGSVSKDLYNYREPLLGLIDKIFADPHLPQELIAMRPIANATMLVRIAGSAFLASLPLQGHSFLAEAIEADPTFVDTNLKYYVDLLVNYMTGLDLTDNRTAMESVTRSVPGPTAFARKFKREVWRKYYEVQAFRAYRSGDRLTCVWYALCSIQSSVNALRNRGVLSLLMRAAVGDHIFTWLKPTKNSQMVLPGAR